MVTATLCTMVCDSCGKECLRWSDKSNFRTCDCGKVLHIKGGNFTNAGNYYHVSESLGIIPEQAEEHRKQWPTVDILEGGKLGFRSVRDQERYANHFGMDKKVQKLR
jgi:hypothetical protein